MHIYIYIYTYTKHTDTITINMRSLLGWLRLGRLNICQATLT